MATITLAIEVTITDRQRDELMKMAPGMTQTEALSGLATGALEDLAMGGMMIRPMAAKRLASSLTNVYDEAALVAMVEKGAKRFGEASVIEYAVDPIWMQPMKEWAKSNGQTVSKLWKDCIDTAMDQEWFFSFNREHQTVYMSNEKYEGLKAVMDKGEDDLLSGTQIADFILSMEGLDVKEPASTPTKQSAMPDENAAAAKAATEFPNSSPAVPPLPVPAVAMAKKAKDAAL